jgi:serine/threonine-protein kinase
MSRPSEHQHLPRASTADEARVGTVIDGRYRLDGIVGRGGMGLVYKAEHVGIRRKVALKLLHTSLAAVPELRSRFEREARAIGVISHPNCVDVSDFGELEDGSLYLVMEYVDGQSLGDILDRERVLEPRRALRILKHVLAGLGHAHEKGIIHRDVKPENVLLVEQNGDRDFAKILDFGIAKLLSKRVDDGVKLTQAGVAFGTPVYMSPEQALGNPVDPRADLYAASVMGYEMICGRPPFYSEDKLEVLSMHTARPVPPMDETRRYVMGPRAAGLPLGVERVIFKGLTKHPRDRWQSARDYIQAIDEVLVGLQIESYDPPTNHGARPLITPDGQSLIRDHAPQITPTVLSTIEPPEPSYNSADTAERMLTPTRQRALTPPEPETAPAPKRPAGTLRTMTQRVVAVARRQPVLAMVAGAGVVIVLAVVLLLALDDDEPPRPPKSEIAEQAAEKLDRGDPAAVIRALEAKKEEIATDPSAQLQLGHAHAALRQHAPALLAYRRALELAPVLESDPELRANLIATSNDTDMAAAMAAYELLITMTKDRDARPRLIAAASGEHAARRHAAGALVERLGFAGEVDWLAAYLYDLDQGDGCDERKAAVGKLRALGDPRAIPALEEAIVRTGKIGKWKGKPINKCLGAAARAAITYLAGLHNGDAGQ